MPGRFLGWLFDRAIDAACIAALMFLLVILASLLFRPAPRGAAVHPADLPDGAVSSGFLGAPNGSPSAGPHRRNVDVGHVTAVGVPHLTRSSRQATIHDPRHPRRAEVSLSVAAKRAVRPAARSEQVKRVAGRSSSGMARAIADSWRTTGTAAGKASHMGSGFPASYLALPIGPGYRVRLCGAGGCVTMTSTDAGPSLAMQRQGRVADLSVAVFTRVCGLPASAGLCNVTVGILGR